MSQVNFQYNHCLSRARILCQFAIERILTCHDDEGGRSGQGMATIDRDEETSSEIRELLEQQHFTELEARFSARVTFGTAGLRAQMGAGYSRINSLTIIQTSQGLAAYLLKEGIASRGIVVGYDARHNSKKFAELAAAAFIAKAIPVWWYEDLVHTPMVPFGVKELGAAAGIMITASHNPAQDNGYKVYGSNGCQINTPVDAYIAAAIIENLEPVTWDAEKGTSSRKHILNPMKDKYFERLCKFAGPCGPHHPRFVYTPMHGVGNVFMKEVMELLGTTQFMTVVGEQAQPDPNFPTVKYPNPEEAGALDLAKTTADREGISLVLANDPDADRFAVAEKVNGQWKQLTGDQVGVLFAQFTGKSQARHTSQRLLTTAVSSQMLSVMAEIDYTVEETLTGFKWLGNRAITLEQEGKHIPFAYEEALGYMFSHVVHDKDGIAAAVLFLRACADWGSSWARLQRLYQRFGYFETRNTYWRSPDLTTTAEVFKMVRALGKPFPAHVAGRKVLRWRDLTTTYDSSTVDNQPELPSSSSSQMITCWLEGASSHSSSNLQDNGVRFTVRASGTEPKIKSKSTGHPPKYLR